MKEVITTLLFCFSVYVNSVELNDEPIIGVLSQEIPPHYLPFFPAHTSFIATSYVKATESAGARVVPIVTGKPESYYRNLLKSVNGLVLPGGGAKHGRGNPYYESVRTVYRLAKEINDNGTVFPILGVCLGFEFLVVAANNDSNFLRQCDVYYDNYPINFTQDPSMTALFSRLTPEQHHTLATHNSTMNWHVWCAYVEDFKSTSLPDNWIVTSTSTSSKGIEFIASVEHKRYPFYGVQFHPEKPAYEWKPGQNIPRGEKIVTANRYFYDHLVYVAKSNYHTFATAKEETDSLIYNYPARFDPDINGTTNTQMYLF
ncbi:gamma-glutamyl hydrolase-like [Planococcus citri]|uniref:gamma-glutamyl hydrolase-like n=1 Tax=Planococcus citri TaxID=170843 RepID=UPI0031F9E7DC